jgi:hypothetical protein
MANSFAVNIYPVPSTDSAVSLTVSTSAIQFTESWEAANTKFVVLDVQTDNVFVTFDGTTPSSSNGHKILAGQHLTWSIVTARAAKFIRETADATIFASPFTV